MSTITEIINAAEAETVVTPVPEATRPILKLKLGKGALKDAELGNAILDAHADAVETGDQPAPVEAKPAKAPKAKAEAKAKPVKAERAPSKFDKIWDYLQSKQAKGKSRKDRVAHLVEQGFNRATAVAQVARFDIAGGDRALARAYARGGMGAPKAETEG